MSKGMKLWAFKRGVARLRGRIPVSIDGSVYIKKNLVYSGSRKQVRKDLSKPKLRKKN